MIEVSFPDKATLYLSPCASCGKKDCADTVKPESLLVTCDKFLCYQINEFSEKHPTVNISSG
jgi:hypothetical protein